VNSIELLRDHFSEKYSTRLLGFQKESPCLLLLGGDPILWMVTPHWGSRVLFSCVSWKQVEWAQNHESDMVVWLLSLTLRFRFCDLARPDSLEVLEAKLALSPGDRNYLGMIRTDCVDC